MEIIIIETVLYSEYLFIVNKKCLIVACVFGLAAFMPRARENEGIWGVIHNKDVRTRGKGLAKTDAPVLILPVKGKILRTSFMDGL